MDSWLSYKIVIQKNKTKQSATRPLLEHQLHWFIQNGITNKVDNRLKNIPIMVSPLLMGGVCVETPYCAPEEKLDTAGFTSLECTGNPWEKKKDILRKPIKNI